jgi:argininosuccinate lyase
LDKGCELGDLSLDELRQFGEEFGEDFFAGITLAATVDCHDVIGGTAVGRVKSAIGSARKRIDMMKKARAAGGTQVHV